jgi:glyoxylase-like metal-dependent hydrolase (beta-lactamase superfamily II)
MKPTELERLTRNILYLPHYEETDRPVLAAVSGRDATLIVDAGNSADHARLFLSGLSGQNVPPPKYVVITHWHWDHVFGIAGMGLLTFSHIDTKRKVSEMALLDWSDQALDKRVAEGTEIAFCRDSLKLEFPGSRRNDLVIKPPEIAFHDKIEIDLGGVTCIVEHVGGDHSSDAVILYVPEEKAVFLGDCVYPDLYSEPWSYSKEKFFPLVDGLLDYPAEYYIDSHKEPLSRKDMETRCGEIKKIGELVNTFNADKTKVIEELKAACGKEVEDDDIDTIDAFIAGMESVHSPG